MSIYAGLAAGWGEGVGKRNAQMMDYFTKKSETLAQLYQGLANNIIQSGGDQDIAAEFVNRAKGWGSANPLFDPKGYQQLLKGEKSGIHDVIDSATRRKAIDSGILAPQVQGQTRDKGIQAPAPNTQYSQPDKGMQPPNFDEMFTQQGTGMPPVQAAQTTTPTQPQAEAQAPSTSGNPFQRDGADPFQLPNIDEMMQQMTGGAPITGAMGAPTMMGKMAMSTIPEVLKKRMELQQRVAMIQQMFEPSQGGADRRSPTGSAEFSSMMRSMGFNWPVTQWRHGRMLYEDPNTREYKLGNVSENYRDGSKWISPGPGMPEVEVRVVDPEPKLSRAADGSLWADTSEGPIRVGEGTVPIQAGTSTGSRPTPGGGQITENKKILTQGSSADVTRPVDPTPSGEPTVGVFLPSGVNPGANAGPPTTRTSTPGPRQAYASGKPGSGFSLEKLETSLDPTDRQVAAYITHPENFTASGNRREMWNYEFDRRTNGAVTQAPTPLSEFDANFEKQRKKITAGFHASRSISNILNSTDGALVGMIAGRWVELMNTIGSSKGISTIMPDSVISRGPGDLINPDPNSIKSIFPELLKDRPYLSNKFSSNGDQLASRAADLITTMRLFNFADVVNTIGGVQGVSSIYKELKSAMLNPGMDLPLILGHLSALNRNMSEGMLVLEQARWGPKIPYIREKELLSELYWDAHVEGLISKYQAAAAAKGTNLSRQDAVFLLWRNGKIEADPGNYVDVKKLPGTGN